MKRALVAATLVALFATACGGGHDDHATTNTEGPTGTTGAAASPTKTIEVDMVDIAYEPKTLSVQRGERIEFVFHNKGQITHDAFIGDSAAQADHEKEMHEQGSTAGGHGMGDTAVTVEPGQTGRLTHTFDKAGTIEIGCHQPGHYAAGMKVAVTVA